MGGRRSLGATAGARPPARRGLSQKLFACAAVLAVCASGAALTFSDDAAAQTHKKKPKKPAPAQQQEIELDAPAPAQNNAPAGAAPAAGARPVADNSPPPQAGQMTEQAAQAKRLFDGEKWSDAALSLYRVYKGETGDDEGNKQLAQYHLAIALYRLKFYQAAYGIFSEIADKPNHLKFNETLLWLAKLATRLARAGGHRRARRQVQRLADCSVRQSEPARSLLAAQLPARPVQVPEPPVRGGAPPLRQGRPAARSTTSRRSSSPASRTCRCAARSPPCSRSSASSAPSTKGSRGSRTRRACATSRSSRWRAPTTRRRSASTRTTRRRSTRRSSRPR